MLPSAISNCHRACAADERKTSVDDDDCAAIGRNGGLRFANPPYGLPIIGKLLGHTQSATTQRYAHLDNDPLKKASEHIGSRLAAAMGEVKAPRANVTNISKAKQSKNRRG